MNLVDDSSMWQCQELMHEPSSWVRMYGSWLHGEVKQCTVGRLLSQQGRKLHKLMDSLNHFFFSSLAEKPKSV